MFVDFLIVLVKVLLVLFVLLNLAGLLTWAERKQSAIMQDRVGPNRANLGRITALGLLHPVADGIKMITKEDFIPEGAHRTLHTLAPAAALFPALVVFAVIPFGDVVYLFGREIPLQVANLNVGIVYIFAVSSLAVYGTMLAGWASNNNYALLGGLRASSQMISYELSMGLSILGILMIYQSAQLEVIVRQQGELLWGFLPMWGIFLQPLAFCLFLAAALAENKRVPFDLPEGESEIIGYFVEYSSMKFGMFFLAEFVEIIIVAGLTTTLFFGGWQVPYLQADGFHWPFALGMWALPHWLVVCMQVGAFGLKVLLGCWILLVVRWSLPRFRYDQVMRLGWKVLLPLAALGVILGAVYMLWLYQRMIFGDITHEANRRLTDLSGREVALLAPIVVLIFWIGIYPGTFLRRMDAASAHLFEQVQGKQVLAWQVHGRRPAGPTLWLREGMLPSLSTAGERTP